MVLGCGNDEVEFNSLVGCDPLEEVMRRVTTLKYI
jgi:hypothetical protein